MALGGGYSGNGVAWNGGAGGIADGGAGDNANLGAGGGGGAIIGATGGASGVVGDPQGKAGASVAGYVFGGGGGCAALAIHGGTTGGVGGGTSPGAVVGLEGGGGGYLGSNKDGGIGGGGGGDSDPPPISGTGGVGGGGGGNRGEGGYCGGSGSRATQAGFGGGGGMESSGGFGGGGGSGGQQSGGFGGGGSGGTSGRFGPVPPGNGGVGASNGRTLGDGASGGNGAAFGGAIFVNTGTLTFQGACSTTGNSVTANGGLGAPTGSDLFALSTATLAFAPETGKTITLSGVIADDSSSSVPAGQTWTAGTGLGAGLTMSGVGTLVLEGANTYIGDTTISSGTLALNGSLTSDVGVGASGTFQGTGSTTGAVTVDGIISPGNSIGTLTVGSLLLNSGSTTQIEIAANGTNSLIDVTGSAVIDGSLVVIPQPGSYLPGTEYTILTAADVTVSTPFLFVPPVGFSFGIEYLATLVRLTLLSSLINISTTDLSGNRLVLANYFNDSALEQLGAAFTQLAGLSGDTLKKALDTISPSRNAFTTFLSQNALIGLSDNIASHLAVGRYGHSKKTLGKLAIVNLNQEKLLVSLDNQDENVLVFDNKLPEKKNGLVKYDIWGTGFGDFAKEKASKQNPSFKMRSAGFLLGFDMLGVDYNLIGFAGGYLSASVNQDHNFGNGSINGGYLTSYGQGFFGNFYLEGALWGGFQRIANKRHIFYPGFDAKAKSSHNSYQIDPHLSLGYENRFGPVTLEPFVTADWVFNFEEGFHEKGASPFNMKQPHRTSSMVRTEVGLNTIGAVEFEQGTFFIRGKGSYVYKALLHTGNINAALIGVPSSFTVEALTGNQNLGVGSIELTWRSAGGSYFSALYTGEFGSGYMSNQVMGRLGKKF